MSIIDRINCSNDVKSLTRDELNALCRELREFEIESIAKTGGHLASNLGTVELTVALHRVYDTAVDRLVFDVGHQSYTHKILTGRIRIICSRREIPPTFSLMDMLLSLRMMTSGSSLAAALASPS